MLFHGSTGMPVADARVPRTLADTGGVPRSAAGLEVIPLKTIVGT